MATIRFKAKLQRASYVDGTQARDMIQCPVLDRKHCDMSAFRKHRKYGGYANSDLFPGMLRRIRSDLFGDYGVVHLDREYAGVSVDTSGFLAVVTIEI